MANKKRKYIFNKEMENIVNELADRPYGEKKEIDTIAVLPLYLLYPL